MEWINRLEKLCSPGAPSGFESPAVDAAEELLRPLVDEMYRDRLGSLVGIRRCGKPRARLQLWDAHLDEVGLVVTGHQDGFLRFDTINGVDARMLPDRELWVLTQPPMLAVAACLPPHVLTPEDKEKAPEVEDMFLDVGLTQEQAEKLVPVGTPVVYRQEVFGLGAHRICGKSMDDRACFAVMLRALELLQGEDLDTDIAVVGSTREETGGAGAVVAAQQLCPDCCIALDVTFGASPGCAKEETFPLAGGPTVGIGPNCTRWVRERLFRKAEQLGIPVQKEIMEGSSGTNGWGMQVCCEGIPTGILSVPEQYMHTPVEVVDVRDLDYTASLLAEFARHLGEEVLSA